jgi:hypothetical protein
MRFLKWVSLSIYDKSTVACQILLVYVQCTVNCCKNIVLETRRDWSYV